MNDRQSSPLNFPESPAGSPAGDIDENEEEDEEEEEEEEDDNDDMGINESDEDFAAGSVSEEDLPMAVD